MANCFFSGFIEDPNLAKYQPSSEFNAGELSSSSVPGSWTLPSHVSGSSQVHGFPPPWSSPVDGFDEERPANATKSHSQAEKRRRDRINGHLQSLRKLIPKSEKMDKAALLGNAIDHIKNLKRKASEVCNIFTVCPTDIDEVKVDCYLDDQTSTSTNKNDENVFIRASVCCEDRPELFTEIIGAITSLRLTTVRADMACLGGRIKSILVLCAKRKIDGACDMSLCDLKQSLGVVLRRVASSPMASNYRISSKRQRFFLPSSCLH